MSFDSCSDRIGILRRVGDPQSALRVESHIEWLGDLWLAGYEFSHKAIGQVKPAASCCGESLGVSRTPWP